MKARRERSAQPNERDDVMKGPQRRDLDEDLELHLDIPDLDGLARDESRECQSRLQGTAREALPNRTIDASSWNERRTSILFDDVSDNQELMELVATRAKRMTRLVSGPDYLDEDFQWQADSSGLDLDRIDAIMTAAGAGHLSLATAMRAVELPKPFSRPADQWIRGSAQDKSEIDRIVREAGAISMKAERAVPPRDAEADLSFPDATSPTDEARPQTPPETRPDGYWNPRQPRRPRPGLLPKHTFLDDKNLATALALGKDENLTETLEGLAEEHGDEMLIERVLNEATDTFFALLQSDVELEEACAAGSALESACRDDWLRRAARVLEADTIDFVEPDLTDFVPPGNQNSAEDLAMRAISSFIETGEHCIQFELHDDGQDIAPSRSALCVVVQHLDGATTTPPRGLEERKQWLASRHGDSTLLVLVAYRSTPRGTTGPLWSVAQLQEARWLAEMYHQLARGHKLGEEAAQEEDAVIETCDAGTDPLVSSEELLLNQCKQRASLLPQEIVPQRSDSFASLTENVQRICTAFFGASRASLCICRDMTERTIFFAHVSAAKPCSRNFLDRVLLQPSNASEGATTSASTEAIHSIEKRMSFLEASNLNILLAAKERTKRGSHKPKGRKEGPSASRRRGPRRRQSLSRRTTLLESSDLMTTIMLENERTKENPWVLVSCPGDNSDRVEPAESFGRRDRVEAWDIAESHPFVQSASSRQSQLGHHQGSAVSELCIPLYVVDPALKEHEEVFLGVLRLERNTATPGATAEPYTREDQLVANECAPIIANTLSQYLRDAGDQEKRAATMREWEGEVENLGRACSLQAQIVDALRSLLEASSPAALSERLAVALSKCLWSSAAPPRICAETLQLSDERLLGPSAQAFHRTMLDVHPPSAWDPTLESNKYETPIAVSLGALYKHKAELLPKLDLERTREQFMFLVMFDSRGQTTSWNSASSDVNTDQARSGLPHERKNVHHREILPGLYDKSGFVERVEPRKIAQENALEMDEDAARRAQQYWLAQHVAQSNRGPVASIVHVPTRRRLLMPLAAADCGNDEVELEEQEAKEWDTWTATSGAELAFELAFMTDPTVTASRPRDTPLRGCVYFRQGLVVSEGVTDEEDFDVTSWDIDDVLPRNAFGDIELLTWLHAVNRLTHGISTEMLSAEDIRKRQVENRVDLEEAQHELANATFSCFQEYLQSAGLHDRAALVHDTSVPHGIIACGDLSTLLAQKGLPGQIEHPGEEMAKACRSLAESKRQNGEDHDGTNEGNLRLKMWDFVQHDSGRKSSRPFSSRGAEHVRDRIKPACAGIIEQTRLLLNADDVVIFLLPSQPKEGESVQSIASVYQSKASYADSRWTLTDLEDPAQIQEVVRCYRSAKSENVQVQWSAEGPDVVEKVASVPLMCARDESNGDADCFGVCQFHFSHEKTRGPAQDANLMLGCAAMVSFDMDVCLRAICASERLLRAEAVNTLLAESIHALAMQQGESPWARRLRVLDTIETIVQEIVPCQTVVVLVLVRIAGEEAVIQLDDAQDLKSADLEDASVLSGDMLRFSDLDGQAGDMLRGSATLRGGDPGALRVFLSGPAHGVCVVPVQANADAAPAGFVLMANRSCAPTTLQEPLHLASWAHNGEGVSEGAFSQDDLANLERGIGIVAQGLEEPAVRVR